MTNKLCPLQNMKLPPKREVEPQYGATFQNLDTLLEKNVTVTEAEIEAYRNAAYAQLTEKNLSDLFADCRKEALRNIIIPLGLGHFVALYDKVGGNVDTVHNVRNDIWATDEERERYENRGEYDSHVYHSDRSYIENNKRLKELRKQGKLIDPMTGKPLTDSHAQDHIISAKEVHDDAGRVLAEQVGEILANSDFNLVGIDGQVNSSKGKMTMSEFITHVEKRKKTVSDQIENLRKKEEKNGGLTDTQRDSLEKLEKFQEKLESLDYEKMMAMDEKAREEYNKKVNEAYYKSKKFIKNTVVTSGKEGLKMGWQQAFGLLLFDLTNAFFDEVIDCWKNGIASASSDEKLSEALKIRLARVGNKVLADWKNIIAAFRDGFVSGFLSNLLTVFINTFYTTLKNLVRIIREGMFVLVRAGRTLLFPEKGMSKEEAWDAALKVLVAGALSIGGIALEEAVSKACEALVFPGKDTIITICVGILTGVSTAIVLYGIDKWDPFGAKDIKRRRLLEEQIERDAERLRADHEKYLTEMERILGLA